MIRFESDAGGREQYWHGAAAYSADKAVAEAERILATVEPHKIGNYARIGGLWMHGALDADGRPDAFSPASILAEALTAALPVLDALEAEARA